VGRILRTCSHPGCTTLTMGNLCLAHETPVKRSFMRGRPFVRSSGKARRQLALKAFALLQQR